MYRVICCLLVIVTVASPVVAAPTATPTGTTDGRSPGNATAAETTADRTVLASDGTFAGFTMGAAILAVVVAGTYRYLRG